MIDEDKLKSDIKELLKEAIGQEVIPEHTEESIKDVLLPTENKDLRELLMRSVLPKEDLYFIIGSVVHANVMKDLVVEEELKGYFAGQAAVDGGAIKRLAEVTIRQQVQPSTGVSIYAGSQVPGTQQIQPTSIEPKTTDTEEGKYRRRKFLKK
jgi:hypothetical protein